MADYYNVTTNIGDAEIAAAIASNTKLDITHIAFGDGNGAVPIPSKARTTLVREVHRQAVTKYERHATNANWIVIETIIPSNTGGFWVREMGVIANGKLISHGSHAPFEKVADPTGVSEYRLKFTQNITDGSVVEITLDESLIYASQAWVEENFIKRSEIIDNLTTDDATKPVSAKQAKDLNDNKLGKTENAVSASKLETARIISFSGAATGSLTFNGAANISAILTLANSGVAANTYGSNLKIPVLTVNAKGLITGVSEQQIPIVDDLTTGGSTKLLSAEQGKVLNDRFVNDFLSLKSENGYQKLPNGLIIQWGGGINQNASDYAQTNAQTINFPIAFPNTCLNLSVSTYSTEVSLDAMYQITGISKTNFKTHLNTLNNGGGQGKPYFFALGY